MQVGVFWSHIKPFGAIWINLEHLDKFEAFRSYLEQFGSDLELFGECQRDLVPFGALPSHLELYGAI